MTHLNDTTDILMQLVNIDVIDFLRHPHVDFRYTPIPQRLDPRLLGSEDA